VIDGSGILDSQRPRHETVTITALYQLLAKDLTPKIFLTLSTVNQRFDPKDFSFFSEQAGSGSCWGIQKSGA
jgi:hypothetical protein